MELGWLGRERSGASQVMEQQAGVTSRRRLDADPGRALSFILRVTGKPLEGREGAITASDLHFKVSAQALLQGMDSRGEDGEEGAGSSEGVGTHLATSGCSCREVHRVA